MLPTYLAAILLLAYGWLFAQKRTELALVATAVLLVILLTLAYQIIDHFTGSGINLAALVHLQYGLQSGELGVLRFPKIILSVVISFVFFLTWLWGCLRRTSDVSTSLRISWPARTTLLLLALFMAFPLHPAIHDLKTLRGGTRFKENPTCGRTDLVCWFRSNFFKTFDCISLP